MRIKLEELDAEPDPEVDEILDMLSELGRAADTYYYFISYSPAAKSDKPAGE